MSPAANERFSGGRRCAAMPIRIEKLPAAAPAADNTPIVNNSPTLDVANGVSTQPSASMIAPATMTFTAPYLSAIAPKTGCAAPNTNCPTASAKLIATTETPVDCVIGIRNRPDVCRAPMVMSRIALAASISVHNWRRAADREVSSIA